MNAQQFIEDIDLYIKARQQTMWEYPVFQQTVEKREIPYVYFISNIFINIFAAGTTFYCRKNISSI